MHSWSLRVWTLLFSTRATACRHEAVQAAQAADPTRSEVLQAANTCLQAREVTFSSASLLASSAATWAALAAASTSASCSTALSALLLFVFWKTSYIPAAEKWAPVSAAGAWAGKGWITRSQG